MTVCIISNPDDIHAIYVESALLKKNIDVVNWYWGRFPCFDQLSVRIYEDGLFQVSALPKDLYNLTVWVHRGLRPMPSDKVHPSDSKFVFIESQLMLNGILTELDRIAFCVNPTWAVRCLNSKLNALMLAERSGLAIPPTLVSNKADEIKAFFLENDGNLIVKHSSQMYWESPGKKIYQPYTTKVLQTHLENDAQIALCPSIFQKNIAKQFELRIVFMGDTVFPVKVNSQATKKSIDWRFDYCSLPPCEAFNLPNEKLVLIKKFIRNNNLIYGSIDMIVDQNDNYIFLEVNESGQFLWIEALLPGLPLLDCFTNLLSSGDPHYLYQENNNKIHAADLDQEISEDFVNARIEQYGKITSSTRLIE